MPIVIKNNKNIKIKKKQKKKIIMHNNSIFKKTNYNKNIENIKYYLLKKCSVEDLNYKCIFFDNASNMFYNIINDIIYSHTHIKHNKPLIVVDASINTKYLHILNKFAISNKISIELIFSNCQGIITSEIITKVINKNNNICFVVMSYINKDTGSINNIQEIGSIIRKKNIPLICDCDNIFGFLNINIVSSCIDIMIVDLYNITKGQSSFAIFNKDIINNSYLNGPQFYNKNYDALYPTIIKYYEIIKNYYNGRKKKKYYYIE